MTISTIVTRGFGNGTVSGTPALVVTRGYTVPSNHPANVDLTGRQPAQTATGEVS